MSYPCHRYWRADFLHFIFCHFPFSLSFSHFLSVIISIMAMVCTCVFLNSYSMLYHCLQFVIYITIISILGTFFCVAPDIFLVFLSTFSDDAILPYTCLEWLVTRLNHLNLVAHVPVTGSNVFFSFVYIFTPFSLSFVAYHNLFFSFFSGSIDFHLNNFNLGKVFVS